MAGSHDQDEYWVGDLGEQKSADGVLRVVYTPIRGADDALALLYLAAQAGVRIEAVGSMHGNVTARTAARNALRILHRAGLPDRTGGRRWRPGRWPRIWTPPSGSTARTVSVVRRRRWMPNPCDLGRGTSSRAGRANPGELSLLELAPLTTWRWRVTEPELPGC